MDPDEFGEWTAALAERGEISGEAAQDALRQRLLFEQSRPDLEGRFGGLVVGYVADEIFLAADTVEILEATVPQRAVGHQLYFESIGAVLPPASLAEKDLGAARVAERRGEIAVPASVAREEWKAAYLELGRTPLLRLLALTYSFSLAARLLLLLSTLLTLGLAARWIVSGTAPGLLGIVVLAVSTPLALASAGALAWRLRWVLSRPRTRGRR